MKYLNNCDYLRTKPILSGKMVRMLLLMLPLILTACAEKTEPLQKIPLTLALAMQPSSGLAMVALEQGLFEKHGLTITLEKFPSGKRAMNESFLKGKSDMAVSADVPLVKALLQQHKFKIFASIFHASNVNRIIARRDACIITASDLLGKRVATQKASAVHFFLHLFLTEHAISEDNIQASFYKAEELPLKLAQGEIDAFSMREPYISDAKALLGENHIVFAAPGLYRQHDIVVVNPAFEQNNPEAITRFLNALIEAESFVKERPAESIAIIAKWLGVSKEHIEMRWAEINMHVSLEQSMLLLMEDIARWVIKQEAAKNRIVPNFLDMIMTEPLERLAPDTVTIIR